MAKRNLVIFEDVEILPGGFRNFSGRPGQYNAEGDRNFCVVIPEDAVDDMIRDDWNVKELAGMDPEDPPKHYIRVKVKYGGRRDPKVVLETEDGKSLLNEETIDLLDDAYIVKADMSINANETTDARGVHRNTGYLNALFVEIEEDYLDKKHGMSMSDGLPIYQPEDEEVPF